MANRQLTNNLRQYRKAHGYTQKKLSGLLNISRQAYSNYERGNREPDIDLLLKLCQIYNISFEQLLLKPFNEEIIRENIPYTLACDEESGDTLYITQTEADLLLRFREANKNTQNAILTLLGMN